jgi:GNAT superfamily N-acetyltransferase
LPVLPAADSVATVGTETVTIRRAQPDDAEAIAEVHARSWRFTYDGLLPPALIDEVVGNRERRVRMLREAVADPHGVRRSWVATRGTTVVGMAIWGPARDDDGSERVAEMYAIYLDPAVIGHGVGRRLIEAVSNEIVDLGFAEATLWVLDTNRRARGFYEAVGWTPDGTTKVDERPAGSLHEVRYRRTISAP